MITIKNNLGLLHSYNDKPSLIDDLGNKYWHINGELKIHEDFPCIEYINGNKRYNLENGCYKTIEMYNKEKYERYFNSNNKLHKLDNPAGISYHENGNKKIECYYVNGSLNRSNGPAQISYYENGNIKFECYYIDDKKHRINGPAQIFYDENCNIQSETYYVDGKLHRLDGPAIIYYYENINKKYVGYYINNEHISKEIFFNYLLIFKVR